MIEENIIPFPKEEKKTGAADIVTLREHDLRGLDTQYKIPPSGNLDMRIGLPDKMRDIAGVVQRMCKYLAGIRNHRLVDYNDSAIGAREKALRAQHVDDAEIMKRILESSSSKWNDTPALFHAYAVELARRYKAAGSNALETESVIKIVQTELGERID